MTATDHGRAGDASGLQYLSQFNKPISSTPRTATCRRRMMNEGYVSTIIGLKGARLAEELMIERDIELAKIRPHPYLSCQLGPLVELIRQAKKTKCRSPPRPARIILLDRGNGDGLPWPRSTRRAPKLMSKRSLRLSRWYHYVIATDHAPYIVEEKNCNLTSPLREWWASKPPCHGARNWSAPSIIAQRCYY